MIGAIICGYQGIGKTTLASQGRGYIDLESGNFYVNGKRDENWFVPYGNIAVHLANQGYRVFVSSHAVVREYLKEFSGDVPLVICFPSFSLRDAWTEKLKKRYHDSGLEKDFRAWKNAEERYNENIKELHETAGFVPVIISAMHYNLESALDDAIWNILEVDE